MKERKEAGLFLPPYLTGIFGHNIQYSLSPLIHSSMDKLLDANLCYGRFDVPPEKFAAAFNGFKALGMKGANITQPYKTEVLKYIGSLSAEAETVGAVNTVNLEEDGGYRGYNTDITGFIKAVNYEFKESLSGAGVILLGAGGASRAALYALIKEGAKDILIINRSAGNADKLKREADLWKISLKSSAEILCSDFSLSAVPKRLLSKNWGFIVNTVTPHDESGRQADNIDNLFTGGLKNFKDKFFLFDISYSSKPSGFLNALEKKSLKYANGLSMLLFQAIESFYIWTGKRADFNVVKEVLRDIF
jgi:shikimate dehydrogenase